MHTHNPPLHFSKTQVHVVDSVCMVSSFVSLEWWYTYHPSDMVPHDTASDCVKPSLVPRAQPWNPLDDEVITLFMIATDKETGKTILEDGRLHHV